MDGTVGGGVTRVGTVFVTPKVKRVGWLAEAQSFVGSASLRVGLACIEVKDLLALRRCVWRRFEGVVVDDFG